MTFASTFVPSPAPRVRTDSLILRSDAAAAGVAVARAVDTYDACLFGLAAVLVFPALFFPFLDPVLGTVAALAVLALGLAVRPLGALAGRGLRARFGAAAQLAAAFLLLGACTVAVALLPGYGVAGALAVASLLLCRTGQGLALGACSVGAAAHRASSLAGWLGAGLGLLLASSLFAVLASALAGPDFRAWGWQFPFVAVLPLHLVALFARLRCG